MRCKHADLDRCLVIDLDIVDKHRLPWFDIELRQRQLVDCALRFAHDAAARVSGNK